MIEEWRPVIGYEGCYEVSDQGRVRSLDRIVSDGRRWKGRVRKLHLSNTRWAHYYSLILSKNNRVKCCHVHTLVLNAFVGKCPRGKEARHLNGNSADNRRTNLCWGTAAENLADKIKHKRVPHGEQHHAARLTAKDVRVIRRLANSGTRQREIGELFGVKQQQVSRIVSRARWAYV